MEFFESNFDKLYNSTVNAFPHTKARQHLVETITIKNVRYVPFIGMKTLYVTAEALNEDRKYKPIILFKKIIYGESSNIVIKDEMNKTYFIESIDDKDILVRCDCLDFRFRMGWYDYLDYSLYNKPWKKYESNGGPPANPKEMPGVCKHIMALFNNINV